MERIRRNGWRIGLEVREVGVGGLGVGFDEFVGV
jgi:hypothetical protein